MTAKVFHRLWFWLLAIIAALELTTLLRGRSGETMSSYVRQKSTHPVMRVALGGLLGWLAYHWLMPDGTSLGWRDIASTLAGMGAGVWVTVRGKVRPP